MSQLAQPTATFTVQVLLFATYAEWAGREHLELVVEAPATVADVVQAIRTTVAGGDRLPARLLIAVNQIHASLDQAVRAGDEIALLPPLAGG